MRKSRSLDADKSALLASAKAGIGSRHLGLRAI
jgi:hypothetical protein